MSNVNLDLLCRTAQTSPFAPFPSVLAPPPARDYTQTPTYEIPVLARTAQKLREIHISADLLGARRSVL